MSTTDSSRGGLPVGIIQISLAGVLWGTGGLTLQVISDRTPLSFVTISGYRMLIASVALVAAVLLLRRRAELVALLRAAPGTACLVGVGTGAYQALYFGAVVEVGVTVATVVSLGLAPVLLTAAEALRDRRHPGTRRVGVVAVALVGLVLVSVAAGGTETGPRPGLGVVLAIASGTTYAATTALGRPLSQRTDPLALTTVATTAGAVALVPAALVVGGPLTTGDPVALGALAYLGVMTMALAYGLLYAGLRTTSSAAAVIASLLEPVTAAIVAALFLDERVGGLGVVGIVLVLAAVAGAGREPVAEAGPAAKVRTSPD
ncbi:DMT family transporter [Nocardioides bizhenqiangii]|uniref:DMT family transporter n=1 Tax=Nocardioides bizhenqiangii TaxID=3095076 RepID=A0ABZ0ZSC0_9ACTN|nr:MULTISPECIES: DMT family transporter [unclassified Nocardioides]MDZ5619293.1 DMT family transporter [Nocardioides sp. HM23]WQQ26684.1 DMT family transporter [Nocardioides sp. HM61]